ncbi:PREDICTED: UDP-glycosyltransferase 74E2-like [Prunus mume]|uniref:Glycosyltransferase n=1 Tax=Prunus mume TaxID=102107 RepID=A0ABM0P8I0_PRUMU|nr:PREDICTED: UDP-glycosyltransferase 74E2-like [Prunus mume]
MEKRERAHCLVFFCPIQGHINPMLQFSKRLEHKGLEVTLITTLSVHKATHEGGEEQSTTSFSSIALETISDGFDGEGGSAQAESVQAYRDRVREIGSQTLAELIDKLSASGHPADCLVYDPVFPWALDVAKRVGIAAAAFVTVSCAVTNIFSLVHNGLLKLPLNPNSQILLPGLPPLQPSDTPSFIHVPESYPAFLKLSVDLFSNLCKADWVFCNTFYELEQEVIEYWMTKFWTLRTIGPTIPSMYLDKRHEDNNEYGLSLLKLNSDPCMKWLNAKPKGSVAYMSFGSLAELGEEQMEELGLGLRRSKRYFLWVVRTSESVKLPKGFAEETSEKGLVVSWCPQLEVLAHEAVGCFVTHCGWNSTLEALSLGVPMVAVPQWADQSTNAKFIMDVWKIGLKAQADEKGIVRGEEIAHCVREILDGERGEEIRKNASKWKALAKNAVDEGGSSDKNIDEFIAKLVLS